jgi:hypothetical protein
VKVSLYAGTKHTFATDAAARGVSESALQTVLGRADVRSTRRYARMADSALLEVLRPPRGAARRGARELPKMPSESGSFVVEAAGIEPGVGKAASQRNQAVTGRRSGADGARTSPSQQGRQNEVAGGLAGTPARGSITR